MPVENILAGRDFTDLLSLFSHDDNDIVIKAMDAIIKILDCGGDITKSIKSPLQDDFRDAGGIILTLSTLTTRAESNRLIKLRGVNLLRICARNHENCQVIMEEEGIFLLFHYFQDSSSSDDDDDNSLEVQEGAAGCLVNLCDVANIRESIFQLGGFDLIMTVLQQSVSKAAVAATASIATSDANRPYSKLIRLTLSIIDQFTNAGIEYQHELLILPGFIDLLIDCMRGISDVNTMGVFVTILIAIFEMPMNLQQQQQVNAQTLKEMKSLYPSIWSFPKKFHETGGITVCKTLLQAEYLSPEVKSNVLALLDKARDSLSHELFDSNLLSVLIDVGMASHLESEDSKMMMDTLRHNCFELSVMLIQSQVEEQDRSIIECRAIDQSTVIQRMIGGLKDSHQLEKLQGVMNELMFLLSRLLYNNVNLGKVAVREDAFSALATVLSKIQSSSNETVSTETYPIEEMQINILLSLAAMTDSVGGITITKGCNLIPQLVNFIAPSASSSSLKELSLQILSSLASVGQNKPLIQDTFFVEYVLLNIEGNVDDGVSKVLYLSTLQKFIYSSSDLCRIDAYKKTLLPEGKGERDDASHRQPSSSRLLNMLYTCIESNREEEEVKETRLVALKIIKSLTCITALKVPLFKEHDLLHYLAPLLDLRHRYPSDRQYESEVRKSATSILLDYCGPHLDDEDASLFAKYQIAQRMTNLLSFETEKYILDNTKDIQKWIGYMLDMVAFRNHVKLLQGSQWIAPFECTLYRCHIPLELRRLIKQYLYQPLTNQNIRKIAMNWQIHDPMITYKVYGHISEWDTSKVTNMDYIFSHMYSPTYRSDGWFNEDIENWDVSNVTSMICMFQNCQGFNKPLNLWNVENVEDMSLLFNDAIMFNQPLDKWNVKKVKNFYGMFQGAIAYNQLHVLFSERVKEEEMKKVAEEERS